MANWKKVLVSGSSIEVANISASGDLIVKNIPNNDGSGINTLVYDTTSGKIFYTGSYGGGGGGDSFFTEFATDNIRTENNVFITGAATLAAAPAAVSRIATQSANNYALLVSQSAYFYNHNVGYPTSNAWGQNSGSDGETLVANYLDSPATTSALTYQVQAARQNSGSSPLLINVVVNGTYGGVSSITLMEIAA
jgi:hypothetical protein